MFWVVNADGCGSETHIMKSFSPSTPSPYSMTNIFIGSTVKFTLCGQMANRYVDCFKPEQADCRECVTRWSNEAFNEMARSASRAAMKDSNQGRGIWWQLIKELLSRS